MKENVQDLAQKKLLYYTILIQVISLMKTIVHCLNNVMKIYNLHIQMAHK